MSKNVNEFVVVETEYGPVKGTRKSSILGLDYTNFQGIPYMKAPTKKLRFRAPQPPEKWTEPRELTPELSFPSVNFVALKPDGQEDAGIINVYTKNIDPKKKVPVMVWIYGGSFQAGSSQTNLYGPDYILQKDVILVTFNYRIGAFGFLCFEDPQLDVPGNAGLKDQVMALKWVKTNIANFGGDPDNVTLFGESAGGASVHYLMMSELSRGLFHKAIMMSGVAFNTCWSLQPPRNRALRLANLLGYKVSQNDRDVLEFLENADAMKILELNDKILTKEEKEREQIFPPYGPRIEPYESDNCFLPKHPILMAHEAWGNDIDCIIGGTSNEGLIRGFYWQMSNNQSDLLAMQDPRCFVPIIELGLKFDDPKVVEIGKVLKHTYYGCLQPSKTNVDGYFAYSSDLCVLHGMQRAIQSRAASNGNGKTFVYRLGFSSELNWFKKFPGGENYTECEHGATIFYMFNGAAAPIPAIDSIEFKSIMKTVNFVTSFAINGDPNCAAFADVEWKAIESPNLPLKVLDIGNETTSFIDFPETERLNVWNKIYDDAGVDLY